MLITFFMISCSFHYDNYIFLFFLFFNSALIPSMDKGIASFLLILSQSSPFVNLYFLILFVLPNSKRRLL